MPEEGPQQLNGVDLSAFNAVRRRYTEEPATSCRVSRASASWTGGFTMNVDMGRDGKIVIDEPAALGGSGLGPRPTTLCLSAFAACLCMGYLVWSCLEGVPLAALEVNVEADIDGAPFLQVRDGVAGFQNVRVTPRVLRSDGEPVNEAVHEMVMASSPLTSTMTRAIQVHLVKDQA